MKKKSKFALFVAVFYASFLFSSLAQENQDSIDLTKLNMEQKIIHSPEQKHHGFFTDKTQLIDKVEIVYYKQLIRKKAQLEKTFTQPEIITNLVEALLTLPAKGDIYKKIAPSSSHYWVQFFAGKTKVGEAKIYNNSLQMPDTAFLSEANEDEDVFIAKVIEIMTLH